LGDTSGTLGWGNPAKCRLPLSIQISAGQLGVKHSNNWAVVAELRIEKVSLLSYARDAYSSKVAT